MGRWWQLLEAALGGIVIVGAATLGIRLLPGHPLLAGGLGGLMGSSITIAMQYRSIRKERQISKNSRLAASWADESVKRPVPTLRNRSSDLAV